MNFLKSMYVKATNQIGNWVNEERGSQTLEWLGIAAVIVLVVGLVSTAFSGGEFGSKIEEAFTGFIEKMTGGD